MRSRFAPARVARAVSNTFSRDKRGTNSLPIILAVLVCVSCPAYLLFHYRSSTIRPLHAPTRPHAPGVHAPGLHPPLAKNVAPNTGKPAPPQPQLSELSGDLLAQQELIEKDVLTLVRRVTAGLAPHMKQFLEMTHRYSMVRKEAPPEVDSCFKWGSAVRDTFLPGCASDSCRPHRTLKAAKSLCEKDVHCGGVISSGKDSYEMRNGANPEHSREGETSFVKTPCNPDVADTTTKKIIKAFYDAVTAALADTSLKTFHRKLPEVREDGSIFVSVASYRDDTCPASLRSMFKKAAQPEKLTVAVIQQNCEAECETGTGWANTRRLVPTDPDPSCVKDFCESDFGRAHCEAGRVRLLQLQEFEAWGPFFARFLASKLWNGQNYILQIDAHTQFRENWDTAFQQMITKTPSYPNSVLTTYPDSFGGSWSNRAAPLCGFTFEGAGTGKTIRLQQSFASGGHPDQGYARAAFIAAGFFFTHGSAFVKIPFDPYLPYIFMGEEIAMSSRFWTHGFDIYAPMASQLKHAYVRAESSKFWETVNRVFSDPSAHNSITDLVMARIQHLMLFPGMEKPGNIKPAFLLTHMDEFQQGTVRSIHDFFKYHNIDMRRGRQRVPDWCSPGHVDPPWVKKG